MILVGRYEESVELQAKLTGNAFTNSVEYNYTISLSDTFNVELQFLSKLWAQGKIKYLLDQYYLNLNNQIAADSIKDAIIEISMNYGVISPFTSFQGGDPGGNLSDLEWEITDPEGNASDALSNEYLKIEAIYPNPSDNDLNIVLTAKPNVNGILSIKLINLKGQLLYNIDEYINSQTTYDFSIDLEQLQVADGIYFLLFQFSDRTITYKVFIGSN